MKKMLIILPGFLMAAVPLLAQDQVDLEREKEAVTQTALDYMDGTLSGSAERMERAVHPELTRVLLEKYPQTGRFYLRKAGATLLVSVARARSEVARARGVSLGEQKWNIEVTVFDIGNDLASVKAVSTRFYYLLQLAKIDGRWKLINVLWIPIPEAAETPPALIDVEREKEAVRQAALDYIEGAFSGDAERMERALHTELTKVWPRASQPGGSFLMKMGASELIEATRAQLLLLDEEKRNIEVTVYDVSNGLAAVKVVSAMYIDHLQLARFDGEWKIVNVLWVMNLAASTPSRGGLR